MTYGRRTITRLCVSAALLGVFAVALGLTVALYSASEAYQTVSRIPERNVTPFPLGVDPARATITEQVILNQFYDQYLAQTEQHNASWWNRLAGTLQKNATWQQLASPVSRLIVVWSGERTEEAAANIGQVLRWSAAEEKEFIDLLSTNDLAFEQGLLLPGRYIAHQDATPADIASTLSTQFETNIRNRYTADIAQQVSLADTLIIASLIEREASDFENMREISGVIWNRLFIDMPLQLDATLQYAKAETSNQGVWWPAPRPADKYIDSPFNTYQHTGLPPAPITNPSMEAIVAALNPRVTDCLFYFHSRSRDYYCSETYEEHVTKLQQVYGRGR